MLTINRAYAKIMEEYSQSRRIAEDLRDKKVAEIYKKLPRIREIDKSVTALGLENMGKILADGENANRYNSEFNEKLNLLSSEREKILFENGISADFDKPVYRCSLCSDTGYVENRKCSCLKQKLIDYAYDISNMRSLINEQTFDKFDMSFYGDTKVPYVNMTERENMQDIVNICIEFCKNPEESKNLLFYGNPGLGKTFLSSAVAKELLDKGYTVIYASASKLFASYNEYYFGRMEDAEDFKELLNLLYDADLLIIDDLGVELHGGSVLPFLFDLINERIIKNKRIILSTNLSMEEISKAYTPRITSRLFENFHCLRFAGKDIRTQKVIREKMK